jgi:putative sterol carrier protein
MGVKYLSEEWAKAVTEAVNSSDGFKQQAAGKSVKLQYVIATPDGEVKYFTELKDGQAHVAIGEIDGPEATLSSDYDTSAALFRNELNATAAYMSGKLKIQGDLMRLMQLQGLVNTIPEATKDIDVEY